MRTEDLPVVKGPSEMKKAPTVMPAAAANLKNQKLKGDRKRIFLD